LEFIAKGNSNMYAFKKLPGAITVTDAMRLLVDSCRFLPYSEK
jgi:hypothetical protein